MQDPDGDVSVGYSGADVARENLRWAVVVS
jgi:hypothetical protein